MQKYLNPRTDIAFKRIFGTEKNKDIVITLLNEVLKKQFHRKIIDVEFLKTFQDPEKKARKQSIVDVLCKDEDGCRYIIEMQVVSTRGFEERAQYYASKAFISQMNEGEKYEDLKEVIFLAFSDFTLFPKKKSYKSEHITLDKKTYEHDLDKISFTFVDLKKFIQSIGTKKLEDLSLEENFYYFLSKANDIKPVELEKLVGEDKVISRAFSELDSFNWTDEEVAAYEDEEKGRKDNKSALDFAKHKGIEIGEKKGIEKGLKQGIEEGEKRNKLMTAKKLLKKGLDISIITEVIGLKEEDIVNFIKI